jgi:hypothetical protein
VLQARHFTKSVGVVSTRAREGHRALYSLRERRVRRVSESAFGRSTLRSICGDPVRNAGGSVRGLPVNAGMPTSGPSSSQPPPGSGPNILSPQVPGSPRLPRSTVHRGNRLGESKDGGPPTGLRRGPEAPRREPRYRSLAAEAKARCRGERSNFAAQMPKERPISEARARTPVILPGTIGGVRRSTGSPAPPSHRTTR